MRLLAEWLGAAVVVAVLAAAGYGGWQVYQQRQVDTASRQAVEAAHKYMHTLLNFDSDNDVDAIDSNMDTLLQGSTGAYRDLYAKSRDKLLAVQVNDNATARGVVVETVVKAATKDKVVVVMLVDQAVTNRADPDDPDIDRSRIRMTLDKVDGKWLVSRMEVP